MFGINDFPILLVYLLCILSALLCLVYGIINWNKGDPDANDITKTCNWEKEEIDVEEKL